MAWGGCVSKRMQRSLISSGKFRHVAFEVADLASELAGREILIPPDSPSDGVRVAFIVENGAPIELLEFTDPNHPARRR